MILHTCFISYNRVDLTEQAVSSWRATVTGQATGVLVDNGSDDTETLLRICAEYRIEWILLAANHYPGYACNLGFATAPPDATVLHRSDNDFVFIPGWVQEIEECFAANPNLGQLGLRTAEEESFNTHNVGGNCAFRRELWDQGVRWNETPWPEIKTAGYTEDSFMSPQVVRAGWEWGRVTKPCIQWNANTDFSDPYYRQTYLDRNLEVPE